MRCILLFTAIFTVISCYSVRNTIDLSAITIDDWELMRDELIENYRYMKIKRYKNNLLCELLSFKDGSMTLLEKYDSIGNRTELIHFKEDGSIKSKEIITYIYSKNKDILAKTKEYYNYRKDFISSYNSPKTYHLISKGYYYSKERTIYFYDKNNRLLKIEFNPDVIKPDKYYYTFFKYDNAGNLIEEKEIDSNESLRHKYIYEYDIYNNKIKEIIYFSDNKIAWEYNYKYDNNKNLIELIKYSYEYEWPFTFKSTDVYNFYPEYDSKGNKIKEIVYSNGKESCTTYVYNDQNKLIKVTDINGKRNQNIYYYYNNQNLLTRIEEYYENILYSITTYTYDDLMNKIEEQSSSKCYKEFLVNKLILYRYENGSLKEEVLTAN